MMPILTAKGGEGQNFTGTASLFEPKFEPGYPPHMISSIVLAAGTSTRMGEPKALLDWGGQTLIAYQVSQLRAAGAEEVIVVLGHRSDDIHRKMRDVDCRVMLNARYHAGRAGSLRIGAKAVSREADTIVITNVDQPRPAARIKALIAAHDQKYAATRASHEGHPGHPIVVSGWLRDELLTASDENDGLRGILRNHASELNSMDADALYLVDVNTPEEYQEALKAFGL